MVSGKEPLRLLKLRSSTVRPVSSPILGLRQPVRLLFNKTSSLSVALMPPIPAGRQPENLLLAITKTERVERPRVGGIVVAKRLLLIKRASRSLENKSDGNEPSNSLKRISRYFNVGNDRTTVGKLPTNLLLLRSSS